MVRFIRWSVDRLKNNGIVAFITNNSFLDSRSFDGFRKCLEGELNHIYIIDCKNDVRKNPKYAGSTYNVFGIQAGVAIIFMIKNEGDKESCKIHYNDEIEERWIKGAKLEWIGSRELKSMRFDRIRPDRYHNWINLSDGSFEELIPAIDKQVKNHKSDKAVFRMFSNGLKTNRDDWVYDCDRNNLEKKMRFFISTYEKIRMEKGHKDKFDIKWDGHLEKYLKRDIAKNYESKKIILSNYRPFTLIYTYFDEHFNNARYKNPSFFGKYGNLENKAICFSSIGSNKNFHCLASKYIIELGFTVPAQCIPLYVYDSDGSKKHSNITQWGLKKFRKHYNDDSIDAESIFHYTYAILHDPNYRTKYAIDLKRHFPRLPFKKDFWKWSNWGKELMDLHINFESQKPYVLDIEKNAFKGNHPTPKLKSHSEEGIIILDEETTLKGIPREAWNYKLGNRVCYRLGFGSIQGEEDTRCYYQRQIQ